MARIGKDEHPRILQMVDGEGRKVSEVAAEYGCTAANIYVLLGKLRRNALADSKPVSAHCSPAHDPKAASADDMLTPAGARPAEIPAGPDLFAFDAQTPASTTAPDRRRLQAAVGSAGSADPDGFKGEPVPPQRAEPAIGKPEATRAPSRGAVTRLPTTGLTRKGGGLGATLARPGMALMMRTADGEENLTPLRSLDDLLSAVKPILRAAARSPDAVWFSVQSVDLSSLDSEAA